MTDVHKVISDGDRVIFKTVDKTKVFQISKQRTIFIEKCKLNGDDLIGQKYGTLFEVHQGKLSVVKPETSSVPLQACIPVTGCGINNRNLVASDENQKLSQGDILKMKQEGLSGKEIVGKLVEQSETFQTKTQFSQEKYIKKKQKKHMLVFRVLQPTAALLLDVFKGQAGKICNLRVDSLSQLLGYSNVSWGASVAVVESCQGLVVGAVMERMGDSGRLVHLYPGNDMNRHFVDNFNFSDDHKKRLLTFPLNKLASLENNTLDFSDSNAFGGPATEEMQTDDHFSEPIEKRESEVPVVSNSKVKEDSSGDVTGENCDLAGEYVSVDESSTRTVQAADSRESVCGSATYSTIVGPDSTVCLGNSEVGVEVKDSKSDGQGRKKHTRGKPMKQEEQEKRRQQRQKQLQEASAVLCERNLDSLIIATKHDPVSLLLRLLPFVAPSRPVVVFSQHLEALVECYSEVKEKNLGVQLRLTESWYREYQVLPSRTHPLVNMSGTGGHLLSFYKVVSQLT